MNRNSCMYGNSRSMRGGFSQQQNSMGNRKYPAAESGACTECSAADEMIREECAVNAFPSRECKSPSNASFQSECKNASESVFQEECRNASGAVFQEECRNASGTAFQKGCRSASGTVFQEECKSAAAASLQDRYGGIPADFPTGNRRQLRNYIDEVSFGSYELRLYLDTHPDEEAAIQYFLDYCKRRRAAVRAYEERFGPLKPDSAGQNADAIRQWVTQPWPWEGGDC